MAIAARIRHSCCKLSSRSRGCVELRQVSAGRRSGGKVLFRFTCDDYCDLTVQTYVNGIEQQSELFCDGDSDGLNLYIRVQYSAAICEHITTCLWHDMYHVVNTMTLEGMHQGIMRGRIAVCWTEWTTVGKHTAAENIS